MTTFNRMSPSAPPRYGPAWFLLAVLSLSPINSIAAGAEALDKPLTRYQETSRENGFFSFCSNVVKMPCGREMFPSGKHGSSSAVALLDLSNTTPRKVLDEIVRQLPDSRWELRDGILNVEPRHREGEDILSRRIPSISLHGVSSVQAALDTFDEAGISISYQEMGHKQRFGTVDLDLKDVSVRDALNAIAKADGDLMWLFAHSGNPESSTKGSLILFSNRRTGGATFSEERRKTKRWKREHGASDDKKPAR